MALLRMIPVFWILAIISIKAYNLSTDTDDCGLFMIAPDSKLHPISLTSVHVRSTIIHVAAQTEVTQVYVNREEQPIETIYFFPIDPKGAVVHFHAELDGKIIKATVKPKEEAKAQYDQAVASKKTAFLGEENQADIFKVKIGFLKPGQRARIVLRYITELTNEKNSNATLRFFIPTTVAPRYTPKNATDEPSIDLANATFTRDASPPLTIQVKLTIQGTFNKIESPTHNITTSEMGQVKGQPRWSTAKVDLKSDSMQMDRDFVLLVTPNEPHKPRVYVEKLEKSTALMVHLIPSFKLKEQKSELIFVLDRSGSMIGHSMTLAKKALQLFLHSMPEDCYFNVVGFGSTFSFLFNESVKYDDISLRIAKEHAKDLGANLGGTEILEPMLEIFRKKLVPGYLRQIFVLTDGEVSNADEVIGVTRVKAYESRVFALGIGDGASHHLVEGIAKAGGGTSAFVTNDEVVDAKVLQQLRDALQPSLTNAKVTWNGLPDDLMPSKKVLLMTSTTNETENIVLDTAGQNVTDGGDDVDVMKNLRNSGVQAPEKIPPIYAETQMVIVGLFQGQIRNDVTGVTLRADSPDGPLKFKTHLMEDRNKCSDPETKDILHVLAAVKLVRELELNLNGVKQRKYFFSESTANEKEEQELKQQIVELATKFGLASSFTSFVAVDNSTEEIVPDSWVMQTRKIASKVANGWHGSFGQSSFTPFIPFGGLAFSSASFSSNIGGISGYGRPQYAGLMMNNYGGGIMEDRLIGGDRKVTLDPLHNLIDLQSFDGSFILDAKFSAAVGKQEEKLRTELTKDSRLNEKSWATALAVTYMETKLSGQKKSWELVVEKARKWIQKNNSTNFDHIMEKAQNFMKG